MKTKLTNTFILFLFVPFFLHAQQSVVGHWEGAIKIMGQNLNIKVDFKSQYDSLTGTIDIPQQNAIKLPLKNIRHQNPNVHFELPAGPGLAVFDGELKSDSIVGKFTQAGLSGAFNIGRTEIKAEPVHERDKDIPVQYKSIVDYWNGGIDLNGMSLGIILDIYTSKGKLESFIDIPMQNAKGLTLTNVRFDSSKLHFELKAGPGLAVADGELKSDSITGTFTQAGMVASIKLKRGKPIVEEVKDENVPYKKEEVIFHNDTITLAGTLTLPQTKGPHPAVIMITGSGAQNRDEELFGFKPFKIIADHFTRNGIAVLRYDDRGIGGSTGSTMNSTTADFAEDVLAGVRFLKTRSDIDVKHIGLCGHSEGGIVAPLVASKSKDISFIIMIAGTGVPGDSIILEQSRLIMIADSVPEEKIRESQAATRMSLAAAKNDTGWDEFRAACRKTLLDEIDKMPELQRKSITDVDEFIKVSTESQIKTLKTPWYKFFISYDPRPALEKVTCPVLALFGEFDLQVPAQLNKKAIGSALKKARNSDVTMKVFPNANHLFLSTNTGSPKEYMGMKKEFVPGFLETMSEWILKRVK